MQGDVLLESKTLRNEVVIKTGVLEKVKFLRLLPDNQHATAEMVANFYEVPVETVRTTSKRFRDELQADGLVFISKEELKFKMNLSSEKLVSEGYIGKRAAGILLFPRRAILRVGMLLRDSEIAKQVRTYLLDAEHATTAQDVERLRIEIELLDRKYSLKQLEIEQLKTQAELDRIQAEREKNMRLLAFVEKYTLPADFQKAVISRLAGLEVQPAVKYYATEQLAGQFTFEFGTKITGMRLSMLAKAHGIRPDREVGEMENEFAVVSITPAVNKKTGRVIEGKVVEQILYKETAVPVLRSLVKQWLETQPEKPKKKAEKPAR